MIDAEPARRFWECLVIEISNVRGELGRLLIITLPSMSQPVTQSFVPNSPTTEDGSNNISLDQKRNAAILTVSLRMDSVSLLLPCFNAAKFLPTMARLIQAQTRPFAEVISL